MFIREKLDTVAVILKENLHLRKAQKKYNRPYDRCACDATAFERDDFALYWGKVANFRYEQLRWNVVKVRSEQREVASRLSASI